MSSKLETCPLCGTRLATAGGAHRPFCSQGCKDRDLLNWLGEAYRAPASGDEEDGGSSGLDNRDEA